MLTTVPFSHWQTYHIEIRQVKSVRYIRYIVCCWPHRVLHSLCIALDPFLYRLDQVNKKLCILQFWQKQSSTGINSAYLLTLASSGCYSNVINCHISSWHSCPLEFQHQLVVAARSHWELTLYPLTLSSICGWTKKLPSTGCGVTLHIMQNITVFMYIFNWQLISRMFINMLN